MARTTTNKLHATTQTEGIPWDEIKVGDVLVNYGHLFSLYIMFVESINPESMTYTIISVVNMGDVRIKTMSSLRKDYDEMLDKYKD